jgi:hypothetical protein
MKKPAKKGRLAKQQKFPSGWNEKRVRKVLAHYENQTEDEAVAEDDAANKEEQRVAKQTTAAEAVKQWLMKQGYRLEYITYSAFKKVGLQAGVGSFAETIDGKRREIDAYAWSMSKGRTANCYVRAICECKYSQEKPWVVMQIGLPADLQMDWDCLPKSPNLASYSNRIIEHQSALGTSWHFSPLTFFGHNLVQAFRSENRDDAYDSTMKIAAAAWDLAETPSRRGGDQLVVVIPCIVVEAPLFQASFNDEAQSFEVKSISQARISWEGYREGTVIDVVQVSALDQYAAALRHTFKMVHGVIRDLTLQG